MLTAAMAGAQTAPAAPGMPGYQPTVPAIPATPVLRPLPPSQWTGAQIGQSFELADSDANGQLTRAEAQQLTIMPRSFEDMDENKDGVIGREEYESVFTR
jgi:Ca2+-binding EF-hand superfamily protein